MKNSEEREWRGKSRGGSWGHAFFVGLIRLVGVVPAYFFLALVVVYFIPFAPKATRAIYSYNRKRLNYGRWKSLVKLYLHYYTFGQTLIDKIAIANGLSDQYHFEYENYDAFLHHLDAGSVTILGGHIGCWEIGSQFFGTYASRLNIAMFDGEYQKIKEVIKTSDASYKVIALNEGGIDSLLKIKQAFDRKEYVCFQGDRYMNKESVSAHPFMGETALFPKGPTLIAAKFKTPVIIYFAMREKGRSYRFLFQVIEGGCSQQELLRQYVAMLESVVKQYPQQWFNFYDVWQSESH
ncbi:MAG: acyltransferase [Phocaeicola sp.]